ncbi:MAG: 1,4-alpha-glucan-branching enzyme [Ruminococcaceae bacterium]|nr:1,4-alpha-glucan-branching enzyme [Oscillospiraceae bacterium]
MYRILELNPQLAPFAGDIDLRMFLYRATKGRILGEGQTLNDFANAHNYYGFHRVEGGWVYREWAPSAYQLYLEGEFNNWNQTSHPLHRTGDGNWEIFLEGENTLWDGCKVKTVVDANLTRTEHIPLYARRVVQEKHDNSFVCEVVDPANKFEWTDGDFKTDKCLYIYEAHVGMAQEEGKVGSYREFADITLPHVKEAGYNTIQLMAIMEHPYYGSFGYQVSNFFAASSWFGKPEDLKYLVNKAHSMGIQVLLDVVHSHAVKNTAEGINMFDGTTWQFFHDGQKGEHPAWGTKCFDYGKTGVIHFLLSNLKFWMTEYHFDGFRFDGVTSMLYHDHGLGTDFNSNDKYFSYNTHTEAITYLQLANELIRQVNPDAITVAEDMSGMPGMCLPIEDGGIGFDYRLAMGLPDMWIKAVKQQDEFWDINKMWGDMCLRRPGEGTVAYVESHDQALVGDQTMIFRLAGANMYTDMEKTTHNPVIDRAIALHKMIRLFTMAGGGESYLNFMGNEFGHPEWIDFPREGNGWSFHYCRRQWSLKNNEQLKYVWLNDFDHDMLAVTKQSKIFNQRMANLQLMKAPEQMLCFARTDLFFVFNFHSTNSLQNVLIPVYPDTKSLTVMMSSDDPKYGGFGNVAHQTYEFKEFDGVRYVELYIPARTAIILKETKEQPVVEEAPKAEETAANPNEAPVETAAPAAEAPKKTRKPRTKKAETAEGEEAPKKTRKPRAKKAETAEGEEAPKPARKPRAKKAEAVEGEEPVKKTTRKRTTKKAAEAEAPAEE